MNNKRFIQLKKASFVCVCVCVCVGGGVGGVVLSYRKQGKFINLNKLKKKKKKTPQIALLIFNQPKKVMWHGGWRFFRNIQFHSHNWQSLH